MAKVHISNVKVLDNPAQFLNPFQFEITFQCDADLAEDLEWKIIYVGSAESEDYDQTLDSVLVGPVSAGTHMFVFQAEPPNPSTIPAGDALGVTVVLITCSFRNQEFVRVGYYVNNEYVNPEMKENPPLQPHWDQVTRNILASNPRVTRFNIDWEENSENNENKPPPSEHANQQQQSMAAGMMANPMLGKVEGLSAPSQSTNADSNSSIPDYGVSSVDMEH